MKRRNSRYRVFGYGVFPHVAIWLADLKTRPKKLVQETDFSFMCTFLLMLSDRENTKRFSLFLKETLMRETFTKFC
jgi:hypothetical protein